MNKQWWHIKVYDAESKSYTQLEKFGLLDDIIEELNEDGLWKFVSATSDTESIDNEQSN